jgi:hypothetical protein
LFAESELFSIIIIIGNYYTEIIGGIGKMDNELQKKLDWMNANLNSILSNQAMLYEELHELKREFEEKKADKGTSTIEESKIF